MAVVVFGTLALDSVQTPYGRRDNVLGGSGTFAAYSASYFTNVGVVGIVGEDFSREHFDMLEARGIDIGGIETAPGKTFHWEGRYTGDMNMAETLATLTAKLEAQFSTGACVNYLEACRDALDPHDEEEKRVLQGAIDVLIEEWPSDAKVGRMSQKSEAT